MYAGKESSGGYDDDDDFEEDDDDEVSEFGNLDNDDVIHSEVALPPISTFLSRENLEAQIKHLQVEIIILNRNSDKLREEAKRNAKSAIDAKNNLTISLNDNFKINKLQTLSDAKIFRLKQINLWLTSAVMALLPSLCFKIYDSMQAQQPASVPVMREPQQNNSFPTPSVQYLEGQSLHSSQEIDEDRKAGIHWFDSHYEELQEPIPLIPPTTFH